MRSALLVYLLCFLALPARAEGPEEALRRGDYPRAQALLGQALREHPGDRRLSRLQAACLLGLGRTNLALARAEQLASQPADAQEQLATELVALTAAYLDARPRRVDVHLARLDKLLAKAQGPYAEYARFVSASFRFDLDLNRNPKMSQAEIVRRHGEAWQHLEGIQPTTEFTCELFWLTDVYNHAWLAVILQTKQQQAAGVIQAAGLVQDIAIVTRLGQRFQAQGQPAASLAALGMTLTVANLRLNAGDVAGAEQMAGQVKQRLQPLAGYTSGLLADLTSIEFWALYWRAQGHPESAPMEALGKQATAYAVASGNLETMLNTALNRLDYLMAAHPEGWQASARELISALFSQPGFTSTRRDQIWGYDYLGQLSSGREAVEAYQKAVAALEGYIADMGGGAAAIDQIRVQFAPLYERLAREQLKQGENPGAFETLGRWDQVQSSQTFSLEDLKSRVQPESRGTVVRAQEARDEVSTREGELTALQASQAPEAEVARVSKLLAASRASYYQCISELEKSDPAFERLDIKPVNFAKLQRAIPPDTLVLQYFASDDRLYLMEATNQKLLVRQVDVPRSELDKMVRDVRSQITAYGRSPGKFSWSGPEASTLRQTLARLRALLIEPAAPDMADKKVVALIPYGSLMYLPFQTLLQEQADGSLRFLIQEKELVVLCKATDLDQVYGPPSGKGGTLVALGNPDRSLPGATREVNALRTIFPEAQVYLEAEATREKIAGVQAPRVSYLHFATHGNLNPEDSRASYLTLAGGQQLSVVDIAGQRLENPAGGEDLNLVTLSACQTSLGGRNPTGSDIRTLADAFSLAGCRSMVASLWKVSDDSTCDLMVALYQELKAGKSKSEAMQRAQLKLLESPNYAHPFYWAPFILIGDWR